MKELELLAPARNADIGIAAIDCGADAVYIAGPDFGARKAAGNPVEEIERLCTYAHKFGARVFVTFNILIRDDELDSMHSQMLEAQRAGADAFIIRDIRCAQWEDITVPLHASTQCAIRNVEKALAYQQAGCSRIILEREMSLDTIRQICSAVSCEVEFFVHGALCVCYSGDCRLSEYITGRSADRGECAQACRSLYDLVDADGRVLVKNKALLSLKDYNLKARLEDLIEAGVTSFKIEGRLKNASYVKNVVRDYDIALNNLINRHPGEYVRASFGKVRGGFTPDTNKTFNRGYTSLFLDGERGKWAAMDAPKNMGEAVCRVDRIRVRDSHSMELSVTPLQRGTTFRGGDGFAFIAKNAIVGFRGDICTGSSIVCKTVAELREGMVLYRNLDTAFEKELEVNMCRREIDVTVDVTISGLTVAIDACTEDGRKASVTIVGSEPARDAARMEAMLRSGLEKRAGHYSFGVEKINTAEDSCLPLLSASQINEARRALALDFDNLTFCARNLAAADRNQPRLITTDNFKTDESSTLMRSKYCIRYELGLCPVHQGAKNTGPLFLLNAGKRFALHFECSTCEMTLTPEQK